MLKKIFASSVLCFVTLSCASDNSAKESGAALDEPSAKGAASDASQKQDSHGKLEFVTTTLNNEPTFNEGASSSDLSNSLMALDDLARKESDNIPLLTTYLGFLRLHGQSPQAFDTVSRKGGAEGAKNFWFLLEAGYGALKKKDYGLADYLFSKAEKLAGSNSAQKAAVNHASAVILLLQGKTQSAIAMMRKSAESQPPYLPSLLTIGFLGLKSGDVNGAEKMFRTASSAYPNDLNAKMGLAAALRGRGKADDAKSVIEGVYKTRSQDRRIAWNFALVLSDIPGSQKEALDILTKYFQLPGSYPEIDAKANLLISKLQRPVPVPPAKTDAGKAPADAKDAAKPAPAASSEDNSDSSE